LTKHLDAVHLERREHACPYCPGIAFQTKQHLTRHIDVGRKDALTTHIDTVHLKLREHACPYCPGVAFGTSGNLTKHINLVHLELRDHACPCEGVAFQTKSHLTLPDQEPSDEAHRDGAREAQGPRLWLLQRRAVREGRRPEEAHQRGPHLKIKPIRGSARKACLTFEHIARSKQQ
jgi:hypothetical protein